jgi:hypothetical protein
LWLCGEAKPPKQRLIKQADEFGSLLASKALGGFFIHGTKAQVGWFGIFAPLRKLTVSGWKTLAQIVVGKQSPIVEVHLGPVSEVISEA